jgi:capsular polysaccharide biosynthesis protein
MEFLEYMKLIKKRWLLVFMMTLVSVLISAVLSTFVITPVYEAKTTLLIGQTLRSQDQKVQYDVILAYQKLINIQRACQKQDDCRGDHKSSWGRYGT